MGQTVAQSLSDVNGDERNGTRRRHAASGYSNVVDSNPALTTAEISATAGLSSSTGYGENGFLDLCQSEVPDYI
jgi:hypothetical protein